MRSLGRRIERWLFEPYAGWQIVLLAVLLPAFIIFARLTLHWVPSNAADKWLEFAANAATVLGAAGVIMAIIAYRTGERRADSLRVHQLFQDYLRMRFDASLTNVQAVCQTCRPPARDDDVSPADPSDTSAGQLAGSKLYALEEMLARVERYGGRLPGGRWIKYSDPQYGPWIATLLTHLSQDKEAVVESLWVYRECYTVDLIRLAADYLKDARLAALASDEVRRMEMGTRVPPTHAESIARPEEFKALGKSRS